MDNIDAVSYTHLRAHETDSYLVCRLLLEKTSTPLEPSESNWNSEINDPTWKAKVGVGFSAVSVANGKLYTMGHDGKKTGGQETVHCLSAKTGKSIWTHSYPAPLLDYLHEGGPCSTPVSYTHLTLPTTPYV